MDVITQFREYLKTDKKIKEYWEKIENGTATYNDADKYASIISKKLSSLMGAEYGTREDFNDVVDELKAEYMKAYSESAYYSKSVQTNINKMSNIGMKAIEPKIDDERIDSLVKKLVVDGAKWALGKDVVENIAKSAISDTINANARIQSNAGLYSYIERDTGSGCCAWCESKAGRYIYGEQPKDFFQVHKDCTCVFNYSPRKRPIQKMRFENGRKIVY